ncbi:MAG: heme biosynthesis HemY N-terminal domain-containing protein, partial [Acetobacteraceae bacterium]
MLRLIYFLIACAVALAIAFGLASLPGHVSAEIGQTTVVAPTGIAALALLILIIIVTVLLRLLGGFIRLPRRFRLWRSGRNRTEGDRAVTRTLVALAAGEAGRARRGAEAARHLLGDTPQTLLLTAEAARLAERSDEAEATFRILSERKDSAFLGLRGLLRAAILRSDWGEAAALARRAEAAHPGSSWLRRERRRISVETEDWRGALALADDPARAALAAAAADAEAEPNAALKLAREAVAADASLPAATLGLVKGLRRAGRERRAEAAIGNAWALAPHPELARLLLEPFNDKLERVKKAQALAARSPAHPESRILLAETALAAGLPGEARRHAEALRNEGIGWRRLWLLMAEIARAEAKGEDSPAERDALRRAATAEGDPQWRCAGCGGVVATW